MSSFLFLPVVLVVAAAETADLSHHSQSNGGPTQNPCKVSLVKQLSHGMCIFGQTFGCVDASTVFVKNCSGNFICGPAQANVACFSKDFARATCPCVGPAPTPPPGPVPPFVPTRETNMNGYYDLGNTPNVNRSKFPDYRDYPGGVQFFDLYSPVITQRYSQVFWEALPPVDLPEAIVAEFAGGKTMAVVGFEIDQVMQRPTGDISVPINVVYNHHFESTMAGEGARFEKVKLGSGETPQMHGGHGAPNNKETWVVRPTIPEVGLGDTSKAAFGGANGGEYRKSFHGYPPGFAQLITSPHSFVLTPMQIDTWNRDKMSGPNEWNSSISVFYPGPQPRNSLAPQSGPDAIYSGLLECPVTTRTRKQIHANYKVHVTGTCGNLSIDTAAECFEAVAKMAPVNASITTSSTSNTSVPSGCFIAQHDDRIGAIFNSYPGPTNGDCGVSPTALAGRTSSLVDLRMYLNQSSSEVTIIMSGPSTVWYGVGFNAQQMSDSPWAVIIDGSGAVTERKLQDQMAGQLLKSSISVVSNTVSNGIRTVTMTRPLVGAGPDYYTFQLNGTIELPFINAIGSTPTFSYHKAKAPSSILLLPLENAACVCSGTPMSFGDGSCKGDITYVPTNQSEDIGAGTVNFNNRCAPEPLSQLLTQRNPTCDIRTYTGGQLACHHMWSLLDADQPIPWADEPLEYYFKFRFWYQRYNDTTNVPSHRAITTGWGANLGAGGGGLGAEFDVPKCDDGVMGCSKGSDGTWVHTVVGIQKPFVNGDLVAAHFHCHAPTCLSMSIANNDTGEVYCVSYPTYGQANKHQNNATDTTRFQEAGFIAVPPCLFGSPDYGLDPSPNLTGVTLRIVKTSNATYGHHGEMAHGQFYWAK